MESSRVSHSCSSTYTPSLYSRNPESHASDSTPLLTPANNNMTLFQGQRRTPKPARHPDFIVRPAPTQKGADLTLASKVGFLAGQSSSIASELEKGSDTCGHESTRRDISSVAEELQILSTVLWTVQESMTQETEKFSQAFREDLTQIITELEYCYEEITECCVSMQDTDNPVATVPWFFKKGRVHRFTKHLGALKATLITMRYVLWHNRDTVKQSDNHVMANTRYLIESIFARNRDAILNVQALRQSDEEIQKAKATSFDTRKRHQYEPKFGTAERSQYDPEAQAALLDTNDRSSDFNALARRFTKRVPLDVHTSIAAMDSKEMSTSLIQKWTNNAHVGATATSIAVAPPSSSSPQQTCTGAHLSETYLQYVHNLRNGRNAGLSGSAFKEDMDIETGPPDEPKTEKHRRSSLMTPVHKMVRKVIDKVLPKPDPRGWGVIGYPNTPEVPTQVMKWDEAQQKYVFPEPPSAVDECEPGCDHDALRLRRKLNANKPRRQRIYDYFFGSVWPDDSELSSRHHYDVERGQQSGL